MLKPPNAAVELDGGTLLATAAFSLQVSGTDRNVVLGAAGGGLSVANSGDTLTVNGLVSGGTSSGGA